MAKAGPIGQAVAAKIAAFGWPTRIAVVVDHWAGTDFENTAALGYPQATIQLATQLAINGPPVLQTRRLCRQRRLLVLRAPAGKATARTSPASTPSTPRSGG